MLLFSSCASQLEKENTVKYIHIFHAISSLFSAKLIVFLAKLSIILITGDKI